MRPEMRSRPSEMGSGSREKKYSDARRHECECRSSFDPTPPCTHPPLPHVPRPSSGFDASASTSKRRSPAAAVDPRRRRRAAAAAPVTSTLVARPVLPPHRSRPVVDDIPRMPGVQALAGQHRLQAPGARCTPRHRHLAPEPGPIGGGGVGGASHRSLPAGVRAYPAYPCQPGPVPHEGGHPPKPVPVQLVCPVERDHRYQPADGVRGGGVGRAGHAVTPPAPSGGHPPTTGAG